MSRDYTKRKNGTIRERHGESWSYNCFSPEKILKDIGSDHIKYRGDKKTFQYWRALQKRHDGTFYFTQQIILRALETLITKRSFSLRFYPDYNERKELS